MDGLLSWSVDAGEAGESTKCPWVEAVELIASKWRGGKKIHLLCPPPPYAQVFCTLPSFACIGRPRWQLNKFNN